MSATKTNMTCTADELKEASHSIMLSYLETRGWEVTEPHGWRDADCVAFDIEDEATVLITLIADTADEDESQMPPLEIDDTDIERAKSAVHGYVAEHPDVQSVRYDFVSLLIFPEHQGRIRHLVGAYMWEE